MAPTVASAVTPVPAASAAAPVLDVGTLPQRWDAAARVKALAARDQASGWERGWIDRLIALLDRAEASKSGAAFQAWSRDWIVLVRERAAALPKNAQAQRDLVWALYSGWFAMRDSATPEQQDNRREAVGLSQALVAAFPDDADVHAQRGVVCDAEREEPLSCLRHYARCLALAPQNEGCREDYRSGVSRYQAPRCTTAEIKPAIELHEGYREARAGTIERVDPDGTKVFVAPTSIAGPGDLVRATAHERKVREEDGPWKTVRGVFLLFREAKAKELRAMTSSHSGPMLVAMQGTRVLFAGRLGPKSEGISLELAIDDVCIRPTVPALPPELPPPPGQP